MNIKVKSFGDKRWYIWRAGVCIYVPGLWWVPFCYCYLCPPFEWWECFTKGRPHKHIQKLLHNKSIFSIRGYCLSKLPRTQQKKGPPRRKYGQHQHSYHRESEQLLFPSSHVITKCDEPSRYHGPKKCIISSHMKISEKKDAASAFESELTTFN